MSKRKIVVAPTIAEFARPEFWLAASQILTRTYLIPGETRSDPGHSTSNSDVTQAQERGAEAAQRKAREWGGYAAQSTCVSVCLNFPKLCFCLSEFSRFCLSVRGWSHNKSLANFSLRFRVQTLCFTCISMGGGRGRHWVQSPGFTEGVGWVDWI